MPLLVQNELNLLLQRHAPKQSIQCLAAGHAVLVAVAATVGARNEMLYACLTLRELPFAEEAQPALGKHQSIERFRRHGRLNVRLQTRAARGASSCKPLFGGSRTLTALSGMTASGQKRLFARSLAGRGRLRFRTKFDCVHVHRSCATAQLLRT